MFYFCFTEAQHNIMYAISYIRSLNGKCGSLIQVSGLILFVLLLKESKSPDDESKRNKSVIFGYI